MDNNNAIIQEPSQNEIMQMRNLTGEAQMATEGSSLPYIKFDGQVGKTTSGHFLKSTGKDEQGNVQYQDLGLIIQGVIIRIRKSCKSRMEAKRKMYTSEFDSYDEELELFEKGSRQPIDRGTYHQLSASYVDLKLSNMIYLFSPTEEKVYKLEVGGGSLNNLWTYLNIFSSKKETVLKYVTNFSSQEVKNPQGFPYMQMVFSTAGETPDWQKIWNELKMLNNVISSSAYKKTDILPADEERQYNELPVPEEDIINQEENGGIDISKIPF